VTSHSGVPERETAPGGDRPASGPSAPRIDAHQHFWAYSAREYPWIARGMERLARDYLPGDLAPAAAAEGIAGTVAVQARQSLEESRWLLGLAAAEPWVRGVVGWVDLCGDRVGDDLEGLAANAAFVGVRHVVQDEPDARFVLREDFVRGLRHLPRYGLTYDLLIVPHQLPAAGELAAMLPDQRFVIDHAAKPRIAAGDRSDWARDIRAVARHDNVFCKVSGLVTEAAWNAWNHATFTPYLEIVLESFGPGRLMFGSDWPVCLLAGTYADVAAIPRAYFAGLSPGEQALIWGGTAARFYGLT